jgi:NDP-sugar pyrophosphorylase family protein
MVLPSICILAGGRGTRLGALTEETPKPLLPVGGRPFIEHVLLSLSTCGAHRVVLSIGYLAEQFHRALGDGSRFGLELAFVEDGDSPAGTAGGVRNCLPLLDDPFIVTYGDSLLRVDPRNIVAAHTRSRRMATMAVMRSSLGRETPNCVVHDDTVMAYSKSPPPVDAEFIDYGMLVFCKAAFSEFKGSDLSKLQTGLATAGALTAFEVEVPYTEIGTPDSLAAAESDLRSGA